MIWGRIFEYLDHYFSQKDKTDFLAYLDFVASHCYHDFSYIREFCKKNEIDFDELEPILQSLEGHCDCEVYLNVRENVDHISEIPLLKYKVKKSATN